ncbi:MAG: STAS domain-containing protein [Ignavibacteriae bacterium]|nr:STAS domain-containing protein [Ignavibacteriota bacterium]
MFKAEFDKENSRSVFFFSGSMNAPATDEAVIVIEKHFQELKNQMTEEEFADSAVVFDLQEVTYICSSFLRICLEHHKKAGENKFSIINTNPAVKKIFKITRLDDMLNIT